MKLLKIENEEIRTVCERNLRYVNEEDSLIPLYFKDGNSEKVQIGFIEGLWIKEDELYGKMRNLSDGEIKESLEVNMNDKKLCLSLQYYNDTKLIRCIVIVSLTNAMYEIMRYFYNTGR